jgi:hypothetical protein
VDTSPLIYSYNDAFNTTIIRVANVARLRPRYLKQSQPSLIRPVHKVPLRFFSCVISASPNVS